MELSSSNISGNGTLHFSFQAQKNKKNKEKEFHPEKISCISGNINPEKIPNISGSGTFLYFRKRKTLKKLFIFQDVTLRDRKMKIIPY